MNIEKLIEKAMNSETVDKSEVAKVLASNISNECGMKHAYMDLYDKIYGDTLCKEECEAWIDSMSCGGEHGQKWTVEEVSELGNRIGIDYDKITKYELWAATHYEYYTHKDSLKKSGLPADNILYVRFGSDFADANDDDLKTFYFNVVCHE